MMVYSDGAFVVTNVKRRHGKAMFPQLRCMFIKSARYHGLSVMTHLDMFLQSRCVLKVILCA